MMEKAFYHGNIVEVHSLEGDREAIIQVLDVPNLIPNPTLTPGSEYLVDKKKVYKLAMDCFELGELIESRIGDLKGKVVGFEYDTNRVICVSDKVGNYKDKRTRYAYLPTEIKKRPKIKDCVTFAPGRMYKIFHPSRGTTKVIATECVFGNEYVALFDGDGRIVASQIPRLTTKKKLDKQYDITSVKELTVCVLGK